MFAIAVAALSLASKHHFSCEYIYSDTRGQITGRKMVEADFETARSTDTWRHVTIAQGSSAGSFGSGQEQQFMEGFSYRDSDRAKLFSPDAFKGFPSSAIEDRNLVWDTFMFREFAEKIDKLKPDVDTRFRSDSVDLAGLGKFSNGDIELSSLGIEELKGRRCRVMKYTAFFNRVEVSTPGIHLLGRSHYWGEIWVAEGSRGIVLGTLYEDVLGELTLAQSKSATIVNVFRKGRLE